MEHFYTGTQVYAYTIVKSEKLKSLKKVLCLLLYVQPKTNHIFANNEQ